MLLYFFTEGVENVELHILVALLLELVFSACVVSASFACVEPFSKHPLKRSRSTKGAEIPNYSGSTASLTTVLFTDSLLHNWC